MKEEYVVMFIFIIITIFIYFWVFRKNFKIKEGLTNSGETETTGSSSSGVAGNAQGYAANIKSESIKLQDTLLISKYRSDYENAIINLDDYIKNLMLKTSLNIDPNNPMDSITTLSTLSNAQTALNSVMKFVDAS